MLRILNIFKYCMTINTSVFQTRVKLLWFVVTVLLNAYETERRHKGSCNSSVLHHTSTESVLRVLVVKPQPRVGRCIQIQDGRVPRELAQVGKCNTGKTRHSRGQIDRQTRPSTSKIAPSESNLTPVQIQCVHQSTGIGCIVFGICLQHCLC